MMDYNALKARIKERFGTYHAFAIALGVSGEKLRRWLNNKSTMPLEALYRMVETLEIPDNEVDFFFFRRESTPELPKGLAENIGKMSSDTFNLFSRYLTCLISMCGNTSTEANHADDQLQTALKAGAALSEIAEYTDALERALGIKQMPAICI